MIRQLIARCALVGVVAALLAPAPQATAAEAVITFGGGGWGHGVGMSQYGALGRAEAGHTATAILEYYFDGTTVVDRTGDPALVDDLRIRLSPPRFKARPSAATVTPGASTLSVSVGANLFAGLAGPVHVALVGDAGGGDYLWSVTDGNTSLCGACQGPIAEVIRQAGDTVHVSDNVHGDQLTHDTGNVRLTPYLDGVVVLLVDVPMNAYLRGIHEVPSSWPAAALEAQVIAARSYAAAQANTRRAANWRWDVYDDVWDQVYDGVGDQTPEQNAAVTATTGQVVEYEGEIVRTFYTSSNGGYTAASEDSFTTAEPFHIAKPDPFDPAPDEDGDPQNPFAAWERTFSLSTLSDYLGSYPTTNGAGNVKQIFITDIPPSGRIDDATVTIIGSAGTIGGLDEDGYALITGKDLYNAINIGAPSCSSGQTVDCDLPSTNVAVTTFYDVPTSCFCFDAVHWMVSEKLTSGVSPNYFGPGQALTRAQFAMFLWRFADEPPGPAPSQFDDVPANAWYVDPVGWLADSGITTGTAVNLFSPGASVDRAQVATFMWRFAGEPVPSVEEQFDDVPPGYYRDAVSWMVEWGITTGTGPSTFSPHEPITRAQLATFLWRLAAAPDAFAPHITLPSSMRQ